MKKLAMIMSILALTTSITLGLTSCSSLGRAGKSIASDFSGGLSRTVTVYDYEGKAIRSWTGKFDVSSSEDEVYFDNSEGKRVIIHGGIVINEEN